MKLQWVVAGVLGVMATGLGVGWAEHQPVPEGLGEEELEFFGQRTVIPDASGHIDGEYGDCLLGFVSSSGFGQNATVDISMDCKFGYSGGGGGGGDDRFSYNLLRPSFYGHPRGSFAWEQGSVEYCDLQTTNKARYPGHGPTTLTIVINCWWEDKATILNATMDDRPVEELAAEATHAVFGVVTQIDTVLHNATATSITTINGTAINGTEPVRKTVFTEVTIVVNEDLKGAYNATLMTLRFEGGVVDNLRIINPAAPQFELGEYVFVLAGEPDGDGYHPIIGQINGKYTIEGEGARTVHYERFTTVDALRTLFADEQP
ncbi:MAG: hypothetical protein J4G04_06035 [Nitrosopumilaceae archaeon]|nr:hypothetical protein [Nitrosopumilaceae archaeon]